MSTELPTITTERLYMHVPTVADAPQYAAYYRRNGEHLRRWEPLHAPNIGELEFWEKLLPAYREEYVCGAGLRFAMRQLFVRYRLQRRRRCTEPRLHDRGLAGHDRACVWAITIASYPSNIYSVEYTQCAYFAKTGICGRGLCS